MSTSLPKLRPSPPRSPLSPLSIPSNGSVRPPTPSSTSGPTKAPLGPRILRRKPSMRTFHPHLDSSESVPSAHSSIYDASLQTSSLDEIPVMSEKWGFSTFPAAPFAAARGIKNPLASFPVIRSSTNRTPPIPANRVNDSISIASPISTAKIHHPHVLDPISERPSIATLRKTSLSLPARAPPSFSTSSTPSPPATLSTPPRNPSPSGPAPSPRNTHPSTHHHPAPSPHLPPRAPPPRLPTPPGLPTFNSPAATSYQLPAPPMRRRDYFRPSTPEQLEWRTQTARLPRGVVMRGEGGVLVHGRFQWAEGGVVGAQRPHPWLRTESMGYVDHLRREGTAGGDGGTQAQVQTQAERGAVQAEGMPGVVNGVGLGGMNGGQGGGGKGMWERIWEKGCWVCCGAEGGEEAEGEGQVGAVFVGGVGGGDVGGGR